VSGWLFVIINSIRGSIRVFDFKVSSLEIQAVKEIKQPTTTKRRNAAAIIP
jgi:hypothetical protein